MGLGQGVCLLEQFHCDICPSKELACSCDGNREPDPSNLDEHDNEKCTIDVTPDRTEIIAYCEKMLGESYLEVGSGRRLGPDCDAPSRRLDAMEGRRLGPDCEVNFAVEGCSRYIAAEGYACCDFKKGCQVHELTCERNRDKAAFQSAYCNGT
jgi:hypothetical protein